MTLVVGIDVGGSGVRGRAVRDGRVVASAETPGPVRIDGAHLAPIVGAMLRDLAATAPSSVPAASVAIGCAGIATFGAALRDPLVAAVLRELPGAPALRELPPAAGPRDAQAAAVLRELPGAPVLRELPLAPGPRDAQAAAVLRELLPAVVARDLRGAVALPGPRIAVCSDLLTAYVGGLRLSASEALADGGAGAVLAAGTGVVAFGGAMESGWRRVDGWGHLLGDDGGGAWIGRAGLRAALRALDGRPGGSTVLLDALRERLGDPSTMVRELTGRADRAGVMAAFAPAVIEAADRDVVAAAILAEAAAHLAETAHAAVPAGRAAAVAVVGNLVRSGGPLAARLEAALHARGVARTPTAGTPLDGAVVLASAVARGSLPAALADAGALLVHG